MYGGYFAAVVTPMTGGKLDIESFRKYMNRLINSGISGIVVCGSTGESLALTMHEKIDLINTAASINNRKIKLIAGVIDSVTDNCIELMKNVDDVVDGFLCICPFYVKPSQKQIYDHFKMLSEITKRDIILYNNPSRVGTAIEFDTFRRLSELKNVVAIKECTTDLSVFTSWRKKLGKKFSFMTGNDDTACAALSMGACGVISVSANVIPNLCAEMYAAFSRGDLIEFGVIRDKIAPIHDLMFAEPSPAPVKYALSKLGLMQNELRMPLSAINPSLAEKIDMAMESIGII